MINATRKRKVTVDGRLNTNGRKAAGAADGGSGTGGVMRMKSRDAQIRMKRFQIEERRRQVGQIETMIEEFGRMVSELDLEIAAEHRRTGIEDEKHFAYSTFARAARQRRTNLQTSITDLGQQLETAKAALDLAMAELQREEEKLEREAGPELARQAPDRAAV